MTPKSKKILSHTISGVIGLLIGLMLHYAGLLGEVSGNAVNTLR